MPTAPPKIFARDQIARNEARAAKHFSNYDFLHRLSMQRLVERFATLKGEFERGLIVGAFGSLWQNIVRDIPNAAAMVGMWINADLTDSMARRDANDCQRVVFEDEMMVFRPSSFDIVCSVMHWHLVNDFPGVLIQAYKALKPGGVLLANFPAGRTLASYRDILMKAENDAMAGASQRIAPFIDVKDAGHLLQRAGFADPLTDIDRITIKYRQPSNIHRDLRGMGQSNVLKATAKRFSQRAHAQTMQHFDQAMNAADNRFELNIDLLTMTAIKL